jgi:hypothetical protein
MLAIVAILSLGLTRLGAGLYGLRLFFDHSILAAFHELSSRLEPFVPDALLMAASLVSFLLSAFLLRRGTSVLVRIATFLMVVCALWIVLNRVLPEFLGDHLRIPGLFALGIAAVVGGLQKNVTALPFIGSALLSLWFVLHHLESDDHRSLLTLERVAETILLVGTTLAALFAVSKLGLQKRRVSLLSGAFVLITVSGTAIFWPTTWSHLVIHLFGIPSSAENIAFLGVLLGMALGGTTMLALGGSRTRPLALVLFLLVTASRGVGEDQHAVRVAAAVLLIALCAAQPTSNYSKVGGSDSSSSGGKASTSRRDSLASGT